MIYFPRSCGGGYSAKIAEVFQKTVALGNALDVKIKLPHLPGEDPAGNKSHKECYVGWRDMFVGSDGYVRPCMSTPDKFFRFDGDKTFAEMWNDEKFQQHRRCVNDEQKMPPHCRNCYQSSHCNWNKRESFIQVGENFAPDWEE